MQSGAIALAMSLAQFPLSQLLWCAGHHWSERPLTADQAALPPSVGNAVAPEPSLTRHLDRPPALFVGGLRLLPTIWWGKMWGL